MTNSFDAFYENPNYIHYKRLLFNYLLRKRIVEKHLEGCESPMLDIGSGIAPMVSFSPGAILSDMSAPGMRIMRAEGYDCAILDIQGLGLKSESIRTVVCSEVLEHIPDDGKALRELARILAPGGRLILTVPQHSYLWSKDDDFVGHCRRYSPRDLEQQLRLAGLPVHRKRQIGSLFERGLTIASVFFFSAVTRDAGTFRRMPGRAFGWANRAIAVFLSLVARVSPSSMSSIGLFECRKP